MLKCFFVDLSILEEAEWFFPLPFFQEMSKFEEPDILFNMLNCLKILCLHGECLYLARKDHPQFLAYIQEKMLIPR